MIIISAAAEIPGPSVTSQLQMVVDTQEQMVLWRKPATSFDILVIYAVLHGTCTGGEFIIQSFNDYCVKSKEKKKKGYCHFPSGDIRHLIDTRYFSGRQ